MTVVRVSPYAKANADVVSVGASVGQLRGGEMELTEQLSGWDAATPITLKRQMAIDLVKLADRRACGRGQGGTLRAVGGARHQPPRGINTASDGCAG